MAGSDTTWQQSTGGAPGDPRDLLIPAEPDERDETAAGAVEQVLAPGFSPADLPALDRASSLLAYFPLLRELTRLGEVDFVVRASVIAELASHHKTRWSADELHAHFPWLTEAERVRVLRGLRRSGWLETHDLGYALSARGEAVYATLSSLLGAPPEAGDLALGVIGVDVAQQTGTGADAALRHLQHNLRRVVTEAEEAITSHSEVKVLEVRQKLDRNLAWSIRARELLDRLDIDAFDAYKRAQEVGRSLSELHQWHGALQRALNDITRRRIRLDDSGLSLTDITHFLMKCSAAEIADFAAPYVSQPPRPCFAIVDNALSQAEDFFFFTERPDDGARRGWVDGDPDEAVAEAEQVERFEALARLTADLEAFFDAGKPVKLRNFVPVDAWAESAYRMSMLALAEDAFARGDAAGGARTTDGAITGLLPILTRLRSARFVLKTTGGGEWIYKQGVSAISEGTLVPVPFARGELGGGP